jgi:hypothetical protein
MQISIPDFLEKNTHFNLQIYIMLNTIFVCEIFLCDAICIFFII